MSIESFLTRELDVRFIDARNIATEARMSLGIEGYPTREQGAMLRNEALRLFALKSAEEQQGLQKMNSDFEAAKLPSGSMSHSISSSSDLNSVTSDVSRISRKSSGGLRAMLLRR